MELEGRHAPGVSVLVYTRTCALLLGENADHHSAGVQAQVAADVAAAADAGAQQQGGGVDAACCADHHRGLWIVRGRGRDKWGWVRAVVVLLTAALITTGACLLCEGGVANGRGC